MLEIQKHLRDHKDNGIELLETTYGIRHKRHSKYPNLISFKYSQIHSPFNLKIVQESRGIILDENNNWKVVAKGFDKFFNYSESNAVNVDWLSARVQEKLDGSLILLYYYNNEWHVATSGTPDGSGEVQGVGLTFAQLFWKVVQTQNIQIKWLSTDYTWVLELCTPFNKIVVQHNVSKLWLLSSFCIKDDEIKEVGVCNYSSNVLGLFVPKQYDLYRLDECLTVANKLNPLQNEGFVVVDKFYNRVKIKSPAYVMLHHAKNSLTTKRMCEIMRKGEQEEFRQALESIPELKQKFLTVVTAHNNTITNAEYVYSTIKNIVDQKEFALQANQTDIASLLFLMRKSKQPAVQCLTSSKMTLEHYMKLIGIKHEIQ
jgi:ATP-dependent Clp protease adapter protein ClpS